MCLSVILLGYRIPCLWFCNKKGHYLCWTLYIHMYIGMSTYTHIYVHNVYTHIHICTPCINTRVCVYVCGYYVYLYIFVCVYLYIYISCPEKLVYLGFRNSRNLFVNIGRLWHLFSLKMSYDVLECDIVMIQNDILMIL